MGKSIEVPFWLTVYIYICDLLYSLVNSLTQGKHVDTGSYGEQITDGIDITTWVVQHDAQDISFSVWDFAGQTVYYNTHQVVIIIINLFG